MKLLDDSMSGFILKTENKDLLFSKISGEQFEKSQKLTKYYQIVKAPSRLVIIEYKKELKDPNANGWMSSKDNTLNAEYKLEKDYYILNKKNKYEKVKLNTRSLLKVFKERKDAISDYMDSNEIEIKSAEDLLLIADFYHNL